MPRLNDAVLRTEILEVAGLGFTLHQMENEIVVTVELGHYDMMRRRHIRAQFSRKIRVDRNSRLRNGLACRVAEHPSTFGERNLKRLALVLY